MTLTHPDAKQVQRFADRVIAEVTKAWVGRREVVEWALTALLARGHLLLEDVPGVGKTLLAHSVSRAIGCQFTRLQLTPDMLPADITGFTVYDQQTGTFPFRPGPVFTQVLLADEINRTLPRTQASLLEAMQEGAVSVDGQTYPLPRPFWVVATQNPIESEGTYPLPEAQRDRFLMKIPLGYPSFDDEMEILRRFGNGRASSPDVQAVSDPDEVVAMQHACAQVHASPALRHYVLSLCRATRDHEAVRAGASPRASLGLLQAAQARAAMAGRLYVLPDDVKALAPVVLPHRLVLKPEAALRGVDEQAVVRDVVNAVPVPVESPAEDRVEARG